MDASIVIPSSKTLNAENHINSSSCSSSFGRRAVSVLSSIKNYVAEKINGATESIRKTLHIRSLALVGGSTIIGIAYGVMIGAIMCTPVASVAIIAANVVECPLIIAGFGLFCGFLACIFSYAMDITEYGQFLM